MTSEKLIPLSQGKFAIVDADDYERLIQHKWHTTSHGYAARNVGKHPNRTLLGMHREIMAAVCHIDHINGNPLDNRKCNLRECTPAQNNANSIGRPSNRSGKYKGITERGGRWAAQIISAGKNTWLGVYETEEDAAMAYNEAAIYLHGEFARLNTISSNLQEVTI